ncbi:MAG: hypothetical protein H6710_08055 [Myxococcales bacterium]|nr:hypothetical protein [Myxococcales bacterium]
MIAAGEGGDEAAGLIARALTLAEGAGPSGRALVETIRAWRAGEDAAAG